MTDRADRLARAVTERRAELGRSRADVQMYSRRGGDKGVSQEAIRSIERGDRDSIQTATARGLERGLDWPAGYIDAILEGRQPPEPVDQPEDELTRRLALIEARLGLAERHEMGDMEAMRTLLRLLDDDQFRLVALAVTEDPRFRSVIGS